jgi:heme exporter protein A
VAIAKLILCKRPLYLIDEPFTALDDSSISLVSDLIMDMKSNGSSFILTGHRGSDLADKTLNLDEL